MILKKNNTVVRDISFEIDLIIVAWEDSFALDFKYVFVVKLAYP
jgi:hypothetical protein